MEGQGRSNQNSFTKSPFKYSKKLNIDEQCGSNNNHSNDESSSSMEPDRVTRRPHKLNRYCKSTANLPTPDERRIEFLVMDAFREAFDSIFGKQSKIPQLDPDEETGDTTSGETTPDSDDSYIFVNPEIRPRGILKRRSDPAHTGSNASTTKERGRQRIKVVHFPDEGGRFEHHLRLRNRDKHGRRAPIKSFRGILKQKK